MNDLKKIYMVEWDENSAAVSSNPVRNYQKCLNSLIENKVCRKTTIVI